MALITAGPMVGQVSGRLGSVVFSHNRGGPYVRNGTIPTLVTSQEAINAKARLSAQSQAWDNLTAIQRLAWLEWARSNPVVNRLGSQVTIAGNAAFVGINTRLAYAGDTLLTEPPIADPPLALASLTPTFDLGPGTFDLAFTATPLPAGVKLWVTITVLNNPAVNYVENRLRLLLASAAAQASPLDIETETTARFGTLSVGQKIVARVFTFDGATGLISAPLQADGLIVDTTP
jgi:hypothetical protein